MSDLISRQAALSELYDVFFDDDLRAAYPDKADIVLDVIRKMPSAQPEIIRCKDCKNSEHWYRDRRRCFLWSENGASVFDDGFCNYAERRETDGKHA